MPAIQSMKRLPSTSSTIAPRPVAATSGYSLMYEGDDQARSRAMIASPRGPGSAVTTRG
jgi:hypothetical protein